MPMKLNVQGRTTATDDFYTAMRDAWKARWKSLNNDVLKAGPSMNSYVLKKNAMPMQQLKANVQDPAAFDRQKTLLVSLPYSKFWLENHGGNLFFTGLTKPILMVDNASKKYNCPPYFVYIPVDYIDKGTSAKFHFVPQGFELIGARHPHHRGYRGNANHPLDMDPSTCWGDFPTVVQGCIRTADTPGLFRVLHLYLSRVNMHSLLCSEFFNAGIARATTRK